MAWVIVEHRLGKAGPLKQRTARQRDWDRKYGESNWEIGYVVEGHFVIQDQALETIYYQSYEHHFQEHPSDLEELVRLAKVLRNPHAEATTSVDLQVPAITDYLSRNGLILNGREVVDIGSWEGQSSHAISIRLSPLSVRVVGNPKMTLEQYWQDKKCLAVWEDEGAVT
ncbi:MAG: hypothetical protein H7Y38_20380 [Armatimonadetes bacterium]|nr:hypothetical protein [Armatimonadota bacterium]